jgi:acetyltransferase-like isoleucine patch superfamily enzyme
LLKNIFLFLNRNVEIGKYTYGYPKIYFSKALYGKKEITKLRIGKFCAIAPRGVKVFLGGEHKITNFTIYPLGVVFNKPEYMIGTHLSKGDVVIGNDVWIGIGVTILSGVMIGDGAIIGANTIVRTKVPPYAIIMGNPGNIVGYRFSEEKIKLLLEMKWWDWDAKNIKEAIPYLINNNIEKLFNYYNNKVHIMI